MWFMTRLYRQPLHAVLITHCNSLVLELKDAEVAVKCRILLILVLLYVDNTILAGDDKVMKQVWG